MSIKKAGGGLPRQYVDSRARIESSKPPARKFSVAIRTELKYLLFPVLAVVFWVLNFVGQDPRNMGALGLLTLFTPLAVIALILLAGGFLFSLHRKRPGWVLASYIITYICLIHGTAPIFYTTLRYSWSYKHVGIVDYILRHGSVDPSLNVGQIYQNWPGFFAGSALMTKFAGQPDALQIASWAPMVFNLLNVLMLAYVFRGLTRNRLLIWLGLFFFLLINWVGQDYFSPQAVGFVLYLGLVGLLLRKMPRSLMLVPFVLIVSTVAVSHQITPLMMVLALVVLVALRKTDAWYLPLLALAIIVGWAFTGAFDYTLPNLQDLISEFGNVVDNADQTLDKADTVSGVALLVVWGGRSTVFFAGVVAVIGMWRHSALRARLRSITSSNGWQGWLNGSAWTSLFNVYAIRNLPTLRAWPKWQGASARMTSAALMIVPGVLVLTTGFGGEVLFRAFLFASPFIAILAAEACFSHDRRIHFEIKNALAAAVVIALIAPGFLLGYFGKEQQNYFTPNEVTVSRWVYTHAPAGSLLVEGSTNYPGRFIDYEKFTYVPLDREPEQSTADILKDPASKLLRWLSDTKYTKGYVLITRGQKIDVNSGDSMPVGSLDVIERSLRRSKDFKVAYELPDATVFTLSKQGEEQ